MYRKYNPNPNGAETGDCTVRAICAATGHTWEEAFIELCLAAYSLCDMPSSNNVWGAYLQSRGFRYHALPDSCPFCYTAADFCRDHPKGTYVLGTGTHVICVRDGDIYDSWDSSAKVPLYYFTRED